MAKHCSYRREWKEGNLGDETALSSAATAPPGLLCSAEIEIGVWNVGLML